MMSAPIQVVVALITNDADHILITQRAKDTTHPGLWEFPGGKIEINEMPTLALIREIKEEVNLEVLQYQFLTQVDHCYSDKAVSLLVYQVTQFSGVATCLESQQDLRWVPRAFLKNYTFPAANHEIIHRCLE